MQFNADSKRRYDEWLVVITLVVIALFSYFISTYSHVELQESRITNLQYASESASEGINVDALQVNNVAWSDVTNPVNMGMGFGVQWFRFTIHDAQLAVEPELLEIAYPLIDNVTVYFLPRNGDKPLAVLKGGDAIPFQQWDIQHATLLFPVPTTQQPMDVVLRVQTNGSVKLPIRLWHSQEFVEYTSGLNLILGSVFGFLVAIGLTNFFMFLTTRSVAFISYAGYVFSLALTLAALNGQAYAYLWPQWVWFEHRAVAIFANAAIMFAVLFARHLLEVKAYSQVVDRLLKGVGIVFGLNIVISLILPYSYLIKAFLVMLCVVVFIILAVGVWLTLKGHTIARYYCFSWSILLLSGFFASMDNLGLITTPVPSIYLLMLGAMVETLLLTFILAISYRQHREEIYQSQQHALVQERAAVAAREDLVSMQTQYQDELEYKVQERTLELEIALRELSEANQELETLNSIDSLTGIRNRRHFDKRLLAESRRSRREQTPLSLAMIDIDHFKRINDTHGHAAGDACIRHVATILRLSLRRSSDDVCRYGGEEFGVILPNTDLEGARQVIESMREKVAETPVVVDGETICMSLSAGVATTTIAYEEHELELLKYADNLLYRAKQNGRNEVVADNLTGDA